MVRVVRAALGFRVPEGGEGEGGGGDTGGLSREDREDRERIERADDAGGPERLAIVTRISN